MAGAAHTDVAAYVLGVLDDAENAVFEAHLLDCPHCQLDLLELHDLPDVLDRIRQRWPEPPVPAPGRQVLDALLDEVSAARRRRRRAGRLAGVAAALLILAGPLLTFALLAPESEDGRAVPQARGPEPTAVQAPRTGAGSPGMPDPEPAGSVDMFGPDPAGASATAKVTVHDRDWGSRVDLQLGGIAGPQRCRLVAVSRDGDTQVVTGWSVPAPGYGVPGSPEPLRISGGTALTPADIERFEVRTDSGSLLATVSR